MNIRIISGITVIAVALITFLIIYLVRGDGDGEYKIEYDWKGKDLKPEAGKGWVYFPDGQMDPTHGQVNYGSHPELMVEQSDGSIKINVAEQPKDGKRDAIRISTEHLFNEGLFIIKASHIPEGAGVWPAFWLNGSNMKNQEKWACYGEIDIIEGVNSVDDNTSYNATTLHTNMVNGKRCIQDGVPRISNGGMCGPDDKIVDGGFCGCSGKEACPYNGCGVTSQNNKSFGFGFNKNGGGVYACELTKDGKITVWFFPKGQEPSDIEANNPKPESWNKDNIVQFKPCSEQFKDMELIINTTLCGDWAGKVYPGGQGACNAIIAGSNKLDQAYWMIDYVKVFQQSS